MLYSVVIIEDNPLTVRSLVETIDWAEMNCEVVGTARDGESGKQLLLDKRPDILLTDIRIPQGSGLDILEEVRSEIPDCKVIIITGYDQFQYASRAIKLAVFDFLLKPIQPEEVLDSVRRAVADLQRRRADTENAEAADRFRRQAQLLSLLTNPSQRGQGVHEIFSELNMRFSAYYIMTIQAGGDMEFSQGDLNHLDRVVSSRQASAVTFFLYDAIVCFMMRQSTDDRWRGEAEQLTDALTREMTMPVDIGISSQELSIHAIRKVYQQARQAMWEAALTRNGEGATVFFASGEERVGPSSQVADFNQRIATLIERAELSDESAREAARELVALSGHQYSQLRALIAMYSLELRKKFGAQSDLQTDQAMYESWFVTDPKEAEDCLLRICAALRNGTAEQQYSLLTRNTIRYINLHAVEGLQLNTVAERMYVSGNYLSALIRKETGITFHEHVLNAKMTVARTMLADPRILVEEVAHAVGYSNYISFYNAFKRVEHMTPTEYRNKKVKL